LYGVPPTRAYLDRNSSQIDPLLRRYLETCLVTSPGFYQISDCKPNVGFSAQDVMTGDRREVSEELASASLSDGQVMFAHLVPIGSTTMLESISPLSFPPAAKGRLQRLYRTYTCRSAAGELRELYFALVESMLCRPPATIH
jgi:hypothetical protein